MKRKLLISAFVAIVGFITAQGLAAQGKNVKIPDQAFKACLIGNPAINTNGDTEISVAEAQAFTGDIQCNAKNISDLTGIEAFVNITALDCSNNQLSSLDISNNTALESLHCSNNQLSSLNLKNGNNRNIGHINLTDNPNLRCIQVDGVAYSNENWLGRKDTEAYFSENCR